MKQPSKWHTYHLTIDTRSGTSTTKVMAYDRNDAVRQAQSLVPGRVTRVSAVKVCSC